MSESLEAEIRQLYEDWIANPSPVVCARLADRLRVAGRNDEALEVSRRGQADWPANNSIRVVIARCLRGTGDTEGARSTFEEVLKADPFNLVALKNLAEISVADGRFNDAVKLYGDYLFENPGDQEAEQKYQEAKGLASSDAAIPPAAPPPISTGSSEPVPEAPPVVEEEPSPAGQAASVLEAAFTEPEPAGQAAHVPEAAPAESSPTDHASVPPEEPAGQTQAASVLEAAFTEPEPAGQAASVLEAAFTEPDPAGQATPVIENPLSRTAAEGSPVIPEPPSSQAEAAVAPAPDHADAPVVPASPAVEVALEDVFGQTPEGQGPSVQEAVRETSGDSHEDAGAEVATMEASPQAPEEDKPASFPKTGRMERILKDQGVASNPPESVTAAAGTRVATTPAPEAKHPQNLRREPRSLFDLFSPEERSELFLEPYRQEEK